MRKLTALAAVSALLGALAGPAFACPGHPNHTAEITPLPTQTAQAPATTATE